MSIRIVMVDDHKLVLEALCQRLATEPDLEVVAVSSLAADVPRLLAQTEPDVLLLDITFPDGNGIEIAEMVHRTHPSVGIIALSSHGQVSYIDLMFKAGARAYVVKSASSAELVAAIRRVARGGTYLSMEASDAVVRRFDLDKDGGPPPPDVLSKREREVLLLVAEGHRSARIAEKLGITVDTVDVYRRQIRSKTGLHTVAELTRYAIRHGLAQA